MDCNGVGARDNEAMGTAPAVSIIETRGGGIAGAMSAVSAPKIAGSMGAAAMTGVGWAEGAAAVSAEACASPRAPPGLILGRCRLGGRDGGYKGRGRRAEAGAGNRMAAAQTTAAAATPPATRSPLRELGWSS